MNRFLFDSFLKMEEEYHLFDIKGKYQEPLWDLVRVRLYNWYILKNGIIKVNKCRSLEEKIRNILSYIYNSFAFSKKSKYLFVYCPRYYDDCGKLYDRVAEDMINFVNKEDCVLLNIYGRYFNTKYKDHTLFLFNCLAYLRILFLKLSSCDYSLINNAIYETFKIDIPYDDVNNLYRTMMRRYYSYLYCLKYYRPKKVFVFIDEQKGLYLAAKKLGLETYEIQHGTLIYEYPSYSYPQSINYTSNISYADYYVHPGYGWGLNNNIPVKKRLVLGNNSYLNSSDIKTDNSLLIISSLLHYKYLLEFTKNVSRIFSGDIIYKLHPAEYPKRAKYEAFFSDCPNVKVATADAKIIDLIAKSSLMVTISSTTYFEAKNAGKRVAVLKYDNYYTLEPYVTQSSNSCILDSWRDLPKAFEMPENGMCEHYYVPFNEIEAKKILN